VLSKQELTTAHKALVAERDASRALREELTRDQELT